MRSGRWEIQFDPFSVALAVVLAALGALPGQDAAAQAPPSALPGRLFLTPAERAAVQTHVTEQLQRMKSQAGIVEDELKACKDAVG